MKIAMIHTPFWARAGGERQILKLSIELQKLGHDVTIFTSGLDRESFPDFFRQVKIQVIPHPLAGKLPPKLLPASAKPVLGRKMLEDPEDTIRLRKWMDAFKVRQFYTSELPSMLELGRKIPEGFDLINNHNFPTEWAAFLAKKRLKAPIVWMCNEPPYWFFNPKFRNRLNKVNWPLFEILDKVSVKYIDRIAVLSRIGAEYVKKAYNRPAKVVRTGVDTALLHEASGESVRKTYGLEDDFVLLQAGSLDPVKRQEDTITALYHLSKKHHNVKLILDGAGPRRELIRLAERLGIKSKVLFLNSRSDVELAEVYAACDVFVYPTSKSTWGMGLTEAMGASKPVIVSKLAGASEIVQSGVNGIVVDFGQPEQIAKQAERLMNNLDLCRKIGENAYKHVRDNLSWEKFARNLEAVFLEVVTKSKARN